MMKKFNLEFFSVHFNVPINRLVWGVRERMNKNGSDFSPALLIKDSSLGIDILKGEIRANIFIAPGFYVKFHEGELSENEKFFVIESKENIFDEKTVEVEFTEDDIQNIYRKRWYLEDLDNIQIF